MKNEHSLETLNSIENISQELLIHQVRRLTKSYNEIKETINTLKATVARQAKEIDELKKTLLSENNEETIPSNLIETSYFSSENDLSQSCDSNNQSEQSVSTNTKAHSNHEESKGYAVNESSEKISFKGGEYTSHACLINEMDASSLIEMSPGQSWPKILNKEKISNFSWNMEETYKKWLINPEHLVFDRVIGRGSSALVYQGRYNGENVAIKVLNFNPLDSRSLDKQQKELAEEVNVMKSVNSKYVVHLYGIVLEPTICIVMEFCERGSLYDILKRKERVGWSAVFRLFKEIVCGVAALHRLKPPIVHRDLKTLNILLTKDMKVKIADFGLSRLSETREHYSTLYKLRGTHTYCAPEVYFGEQYTDKADIYSLGIILWELVYRCVKGEYQRPFSEYPWINYSFQVIIQTAKNGLRPTIPPCPDKMRNLICSLWSYSPTNRPDSHSLLLNIQKLEKEYHENRREWYALCRKAKEFKDIQAPPDLHTQAKEIIKKNATVVGKTQKPQLFRWVTRSISERKDKRKSRKSLRFDDLLTDDKLYKSFESFLRKELCDEYLRFWKQLKTYLSVSNESIVVSATNIYSKYIISEVVAIDPKQMKAIGNKIDNEEIEKDLFENVRYEVESILKTKFAYFCTS